MSKKYITDVIKIDGQLLDGNGSAGTSGQVLSSTGTATDWVSLSEISGVDGSGTANYLAKWSDGDSITNSIIYDDGTNVGIGKVPSSGVKLDVNGPANFSSTVGVIGNGNLTVWNTSGTGSGVIFLDTTWQAGIEHIAGSLYFRTGGQNDRMRIDSSGNVGIGTTSPGFKLSVAMDGDTYSADFYQSNSGTDKYNAIRVRGAMTSAVGYYGIGGSTAGNPAFRDAFVVGTQSAHSFNLATNDLARMTITSSGNVGIGTTSPSGKLDVTGDIWLNGDNVNSAYYLRINKGATSDGGILLYRGLSTIDWQIVNNTTSGDLGFYSYGTSSQVFNVQKSSGNVGIGTTSPTTKLDILRATGAPSLTADNGAFTISDTFVGAQMGSIPTSPYTFWIQGKDRRNNGGSFPISLNPVGGNVGIGTTSPSYNLDVHGATNGVIRAYGPSIGRLSLQNNTRHYSTSVQGSNWLFYDETGGGTRMTISSSGNVGIGTTNPNTSLTVNVPFSSNGQEGALVSGQTSTTTLSGLYSVAEDVVAGKGALSLKTYNAGSYGERMRITAAGNVGIGTASIDEKLHVQGNIKFEQASGDIDVRYTSNGTNKYNMFYQASTDGWGLYYNPDSAYRLFVNGSGDVGIGTNNPNGKLTVYTSANRFQSLKGTNADLEIVSDNNTNPAALIKGTGTADLLNVFDNTTEVFTIRDGGYVGIGTPSPSAPLTVSSNTGGIAIRLLGRSSDGYAFTTFRNNADTATNGEIGISDAQNMLFYTGTSERMRIDSSGDVGINETNPSQKLHVNGNARVTGFYYDSNNSAGTPGQVLSSTSGGTAWDTLTASDVGAAPTSHTHDDRYYTETESDNRFVNVAGDTMTGTLNMGAADIVFLGSDPGDLVWKDGSNNEINRIWAGTNTLNYRTNGGTTYGLWHSGNDGSGSGLDADLLDGNHASAFALSSHNHDSDYVNVTGDTMTGNLSLGSNNLTAGKLIVQNQINTNSTNLEINYQNGDGTTTNYKDLYVRDGKNNVIMVVDGSAGSVGIGTTSPDSKLHVVADNSTIATFESIGANANSKTFIVQSGGDRVIFDIKEAVGGTAADLAFELGNSEVMRLADTGNVGIGTTSPDAKLEIEGTGELSLKINNTQYSRSLIIEQGGGYSHLKTSHISGVAINYGQGNAGILSLFNNTTQAVRINANSDSYFNGGNVGIGTTSPGGALHVYYGGSERFKIAGDVEVAGATDFNITGANRRFSFTNGTGVIRTTNATNLYLETNSTTAITIDGSQKVGIGTTSPGSELEVDGEITTTTITYPEPGALDSSAYNGEIVYFGYFESGITVAGSLMSLGNDGGGNMRWYKADDNQIQRATGLLGIALGTSASAGLLVRGIAKNSAWSGFTAGHKLYLSPTDGSISTSITTDTNDYVRIVGYALGGSKIYFCPDNSYIQNA
jgi:hypothetical protein